MKKINYKATFIKILKNYWDEALVIFALLLLLTFLSGKGLDVGREGLFETIFNLGGSAIIGYVLISIGGMVFTLPFPPWAQIIGLALVVIGWILAGVAISSVLSWAKENILLVAGILVAGFMLMQSMNRSKRPVHYQPIYQVQQ